MTNPTESLSILPNGGPTKDPGRQAPLSPLVDQPQSGFSQQTEPQQGFQAMSPTQHLVWPPLGGSQMLLPVQLNPYFPQYVSTLQQWPMVGHKSRDIKRKHSTLPCVFCVFLRLSSPRLTTHFSHPPTQTSW